MKKLRSQKGSATVELMFIFPMILFIIVIMLFFGLYIYEQVAAKTVLDDVASRAAANWSTADEGVYKEKSATDGFTAWDIYSRIIDMKGDARENNVKSEALRRLQSVSPFKDTFKAENITIDSTNLIVYKTLNITVRRTYRLPFAPFLERLDVNPELSYTLTATAAVQDQPELIRTIDMASDTLRSNAFIRDKLDKASEAIARIRDFFCNLNLAELG